MIGRRLLGLLFAALLVLPAAPAVAAAPWRHPSGMPACGPSALCAKGDSLALASEFYDNAVVRLPKVKKDRLGTYRRSVVAALARGRIRSVTYVDDGKRTELARRGDGPSSLKKLPLAGVAAVAYVGGPRFRGSELDLLVRVGDDRVPVTVKQSGKGDVVVGVGRTRERAVGFGGDLPDDPDVIRTTYKTGRIKGTSARWTDRELRVLAGALKRLSKSERRVLRDVRILRARVGPRGPRNAALYIWGTSGYRLMVYDRAFAFDGRAFVGSPSKPKPFSASAILHEVGHAVATAPARRAIEDGEIGRARKLGRRGPVLAAYARARGSKSGPTRYGRTTLAESFAESFALHKLDPRALRRWSPQVADWFESGGHIEAALE